MSKTKNDNDALVAENKRLKNRNAKLKKENDDLHELVDHYRNQLAMLKPMGNG